MSATSRFVAAAVVIAAAAVFLQVHMRGEDIRPRKEFQSFPDELTTQSGSAQEKWTGTDIPIEQDILDVLRPTDYLNRDYQDQQNLLPDIGLFISYYSSQRTGEGPHSPQNCLPGAGWEPIENHQVMLDVPGHGPFPANRYVIGKADSRSLVLYWFWAHDRGVASEYWAKYYLVRDSIKMNRSDGSLVRIITSMQPGESSDAAEQRIMPFVAQVVPRLNNYIPQ
jgi:EpsI family protein